MVGDEELTFQPAISKRSSKIASRRHAGGADRDSEPLSASSLALHEAAGSGHEEVSDRLLREAGARKRRAAERKARLEAEEAAKLTFEPQVNENSAKMVEDNPSMRMGFLERQRQFLEAKKRKVERAKDAEAAACTFKPATKSSGAALLAYTRPELAAESERDRVERLAKEDAERATKLKEAISEEYYGQFKFKPKINSISKRLGRARSVDDHHRDEQRQAALRLARERAEREEMQRCTFKPKLEDSNPDAVLKRAERRRGGESKGPFRLGLAQDPDGIASRIGEHQRRREAKLRRARLAKEYAELESCSFVPKPVAQLPAAASRPVVVRGLKRHLENIGRAEAKREEQQRREAEAFLVKGARHKAPGEPTVPVPFKLETENNPRRLARVAKERAEARAEAMKECRFEPDTGGISPELEAELLEDVTEEEEDMPAHAERGERDAAAAVQASARMEAARAAALALG